MGSDPSTLRYVQASRLLCRASDLSDVDLRGRDNQTLGSLNGVLIDPASSRLHFYVIDAPGSLRRRRCLLPTDTPARVDPSGKILHVDAGREDLDDCETFEFTSVLPYSDEDVVTAMFPPA